MEISTYQYVYGAGRVPNRKIVFYGDNEKVWGVVHGKVKGLWRDISMVDETDIIVEGASSTRKMQIMMEARQNGTHPSYPHDKLFEHLSYDERVQIIKDLEPDGFYRITTPVDINSNPYFEVKRLIFFCEKHPTDVEDSNAYTLR